MICSGWARGNDKYPPQRFRLFLTPLIELRLGRLVEVPGNCASGKDPPRTGESSAPSIEMDHSTEALQSIHVHK